MLLGHADEDVTDSYVRPELEDVRGALAAAHVCGSEQDRPIASIGMSGAGTSTADERPARVLLASIEKKG
jgi:ssDNA-binding replication factor A large subunit